MPEPEYFVFNCISKTRDRQSPNNKLFPARYTSIRVLQSFITVNSHKWNNKMRAANGTEKYLYFCRYHSSDLYLQFILCIFSGVMKNCPSRNLIYDNALMNLLSVETLPVNEKLLFSSLLFKALTKR